VRILVTRPPPGGPRTAARLRALGHVVDEVPVLAVVPTGVAWPSGPFDAVVLTSVNGLAGLPRPVPPDLAATPVFGVGRKTAEAARLAGFPAVATADGDAAALAALLQARTRPGARVLYPTGAVRKPVLEKALAAAGLTVVGAVTYAARPVPPEVLAARLGAGAPDAVLHFSRASAQAWLAAAQAGGHAAALVAGRHLVLSPDVAGPLLAAGATDVRVAGRPDEDALLALLAGPE
jgi:uroporphyrinogen-III synthase